MTFPAVISSKMAYFYPSNFIEVRNKPLDILITLLRQILIVVVTDKVSEFR